MSDLAHIQRTGAIATLTLNRPRQHNALSIDLLEALHARLDDLQADPPIVLIVTGAGRSFCAGMDLKQVVGDPEAPLVLLTSLARFTLRLRALRSIVIAQIHGAAIGGGCGLACVCDLAVTHADAKLGFPEVDLGLCPAVVAPWVVRRVGAGMARRILLEGGTMTGQRAYELGLVSEVVPSRDGLASRVGQRAEHIASGGPNALAATKGLLNELDGSLDEDLLVRGAALSARVLGADEAQATLRARFGTHS